MKKIGQVFSTLWYILTLPFRWLWRGLVGLFRWAMIRIGGEVYLDAEQDFVNWYQRNIYRPLRYLRLKNSFMWATGGIATALLVGGLFYWFVLETNFMYLTGEMPSTEELANPDLAVASEIYSSDLKLIGRFYLENRTPVRSYDELPRNFINALVATEDARFFEHNGIDFWAMGRVLKGVITGNNLGGGSTISQQLAKNLFKLRRKKDVSERGILGSWPYIGKFVVKSKEWLTALKLEKRYTKEEILLMYVNTVDYGSNTFGLKVAARTYFGKEPKDLRVQESAVLVGLQKAVTRYSPFLNPERSLERRNVVIEQMAKYDYLTQSQADSIEKMPLGVRNRREAIEQEEAIGYEGYFKKYIASYIEAWAEQHNQRIDLYTQGLRIITTIDSRMQQAAQTALVDGMYRNQRDFRAQWGSQNPWTYENGMPMEGFIDTVAKRTPTYKMLVKRFPNNRDSVQYFLKEKKDTVRVFAWNFQGNGGKKYGVEKRVMSPYDSLNYYKKLLQGGLFAMDPNNGYVRAWVGGIDYRYFKYDHVRQGKRQPGSTFKPIVYASAIDGPLDLSPCFRIKGAPVSWDIVNEKGEKEKWTPQNANGRFSWRLMTLADAMAKSVNSIAIQTTDLVGLDTVMYYAHRLGLQGKFNRVLSIGLGSEEASLYELTQAYSVFANGGYRVRPQLILRLEDHDGNLIADFANESEKARQQVIRPESSYLMQKMLQGGVNGGTGSRLLWNFSPPGYSRQELLESFGAKTGTTSNYSDGWFMCITPDLVGGVWVGGDDRSIHFRGGRGEGAQVALPIYKDFMSRILRSRAYKLRKFPTEKERNLVLTKNYRDCPWPTNPYTGRPDPGYFENDNLNFEPPPLSADSLLLR